MNKSQRKPKNRSAKFNRNLIAFGILAGTLSITTLFLHFLSPAPLSPDVCDSLFALDTPVSLDTVFKTKTPLQSGQWRYIYVHHGKILAGDTSSLIQNYGSIGDHFVIGNGDGCGNGEIQITKLWVQQLPPAPPQGANAILPDCISICLIGDFDQARPTPTQVSRLKQLVSTLQTRFGISANRIILMNQPGLAAGIGQHFPVADFRQQLPFVQ